MTWTGSTLGAGAFSRLVTDGHLALTALIADE
jgi:hypothetical protein